MAHIEEQVGLCSLRIPNPINSRAPSRGNLDPNTVASQRDRIKPGRSLLVRARRCGVKRRNVASGRLHQDVAVLRAAACAAHMRLRKAADVSGIVPACIGILPFGRNHIRARLDHAKRHHRTREHIPSARNPEQWIDEASKLSVA